MKRILQWIGWMIAIAASAYFALFFYHTVRDHDLRNLLSEIQVLAILACGVIYALIIPITAWAWARLLHSTGANHSTSDLTLILCLTQPAKYLPGNVGQHIGRTAMALNRGMPFDAYFGSVIAETFLTVSAGLTIGIICLGLSTAGYTILPEDSRLVILGLGAVILGTGALGLIFSTHLTGVLGRLLALIGTPYIRLRIPGRLASAASFAAYSLNYLLIGVGLALIALTVAPEQPPDLLLLTGAFAIAWLVGFFTPGAPAGLGVREGVMAALLGPSVGAQDALVITVGIRLATMLGDALNFGIGALLYALEQRRRRFKSSQSS